MKNIIIWVTLTHLALSNTSLSGQSKLSIDDFYSIASITECSISPNQNYIAYVVEKPDDNLDDYVSTIWLLRTDNHDAIQLTRGHSRDRRPVWSPDSRYIAFQSDRSNINQIWMIDISGGEAWAVTNFSEGTYSPAWSPDGIYITFLSRHESSNNGTRNIESIKSNSVNHCGTRTITDLRYRTGTRYATDSYMHIYIYNLKSNTITQLTHDPYNDYSVVWSHNSKALAFESNRYGNPHVDDNTDIFTIDIQNSHITRITVGEGPERAPQWSPDDKIITYLTKSRPNDFSSLVNLFAVDIENKSTVNLTSNFDYNISQHRWDIKGKSIYFLGDVRGNTNLFTLSRRSGVITRLITGNRSIDDYLIFKDNSIYFIGSDYLNPSDLYFISHQSQKTNNVTMINSSLFDSLSLSTPEEFFFKSIDGLEIHAWLMKPSAPCIDSQHPLIVQIHGGPHWHYSNAFDFEFQLFAASGYSIFYCNPRSSTSYGEAFAKMGLNDWAGKDVDDVLTGLSYVLDHHTDIDSTRLGITGGSYGGYLTNWIIAHSHRFKAAVTQRSISNLISFYGTTDVQALIEHEFGHPWEDDRYHILLTRSPIYHAHKITTPLLIIHGELDYRVPISQAEELFTILKRNNTETKFIRFQSEGHELSRHGKPSNQIARLSEMISWFDNYLRY
ncbi:S9 family peptidase [candidate division KSB1 bacterium]|nr:S9 family peptidase [candidate division KSB1 bacterium]